MNLTERQIEKLHRYLRQRRTLIKDEIASVATLVPHEAVDAARARHLKELHEVECAMQRLAAGTFGMCAQCGEPIGYARMLVWPTTTRCVRCEKRQSAKHADASATGSRSLG